MVRTRVEKSGHSLRRLSLFERGSPGKTTALRCRTARGRRWRNAIGPLRKAESSSDPWAPCRCSTSLTQS